MVLHTHFLNPHDCLEDTMRGGLGHLWRGGFPWHLVDQAIDNNFDFDASDDANAEWTALTGRQWRNEDDGPGKTIACPFCLTPFDVPWTTCDDEKKSQEHGLTGHGYGDGEFNHTCPACAKSFGKDQLCVAKFVRDCSLLLQYQVPMPGTLLETFTGAAKRVYLPPRDKNFPRTFPNRMVRREIQTKLPTLTVSGVTMETVRDLIEEILKSSSKLKHIDEMSSSLGKYALHLRARTATRKMMSRYWDNPSIFALDLTTAVMRQGIFVDKMQKLDWLHSPSAEKTMTKLITKYARFLTLMKENAGKLVVPTLDVDLAWHTHQLSPMAYNQYTTLRLGRFIDHDDKLDEGKLNEAFEWTTKIYQERYHEIYNECTCWYCQTIQSSLTSTVGRMFNLSSAEKLADNFYSSEAANMCPPDNSAHISSHNAVRVMDSSTNKKVGSAMRARQEQKLEKEYQKACKRAAKKGRSLPPREDYYSHWGYAYFSKFQ